MRSFPAVIALFAVATLSSPASALTRDGAAPWKFADQPPPPIPRLEKR